MNKNKGILVSQGGFTITILNRWIITFLSKKLTEKEIKKLIKKL